MAKPIAIVRGIYDAWMAGDEEAVFRAFDHDVELHPDPEASWVGVDEDYRGHDGVRRYMRAVYESFADYRPEIEELVDAGDGRVLTLAIEHGRGRGSGADVLAANTAHLWTLRDEKVVRLDLFLDRQRAVEAAGVER
jgi:ketosteroid isomerase-like protein